MTFLQALRKARKRIESRQSCFICWALEDIGGAKFTDRIEMLLQGCGTYEGWLSKFHYRTSCRMGGGDFHQGRLQWIDHMIAQEMKK